ncbi:phage exclusion protein Lit family protein [Escherichia coli]
MSFGFLRKSTPNLKKNNDEHFDLTGKNRLKKSDETS